MFDIYEDDKGELGVIWLDGKNNICLTTLKDVKNNFPELYAEASSLVENKIPWELPGKPDPTIDDKNLFNDVIQFIVGDKIRKGHAVLPDVQVVKVLVCSIMQSYVLDHPTTRHCPRVFIPAPTKSGKSRVDEILRLLLFRAVCVADPTEAALIRMITRYHVALVLDESQDMTKETKAKIHMLLKVGWEKGATIPRCNESNRDVIGFWEPFSFMSMSSKDMAPEDVQNRCGAIISMLKRDKTQPMERKISSASSLMWAKQIRARLLAWRYKVLSGMIDTTQFQQQATVISEQAIDINGKKMELDDRGMDIVEALLPIALYYNNTPDDVVMTIARTQSKAETALLATNSAKVFYALVEVMKTKKIPGQISSKDVADQYNTDLIASGDMPLGEKKLPTRVITRELQVLGFEFETGTDRKSFFKEDKFMKIYKSHLSKYGIDEDKVVVNITQERFADE